MRNAPKNIKYNNKPDLRANGLSLLPLALRPGLLLLAVIGCFVYQNAYTSSVSAASVTLTLPPAISVNAQPNGAFTKSSDSTFSAKTDGAWGYSLNIKAKDNTNGNNLLNGSAKIASIAETVSESDFSTKGTNNTWGYLPSKLNSKDNTNFQPGPTTANTLLDKTSSANASNANTYGITLGAKVDSTIPTGTYTNTMVLTLTANTVDYSITYNLNSGSWSGTSPQKGSTTASSIPLDSHTPTRSGYEFQGWCSVAVTSNDSASPSCSGTTHKSSASYDLTKNAKTATLYAIWKIIIPTTMQQMTSAYCNSMSEHQTITLKDTRDSNSYKISKLKDGKCWMVENLRLGRSSSMTLTSSDSDVASTFTLPASSTSGFVYNKYDVANVYVDGTYGGYYTWYASATTPVKIEAKKLSMYVGLQRLSVEKLIAHRNLTT